MCWHPAHLSVKLLSVKALRTYQNHVKPIRKYWNSNFQNVLFQTFDFMPETLLESEIKAPSNSWHEDNVRIFLKVLCIVFDNKYINICLETKKIANMIISSFGHWRFVVITSIFSLLLKRLLAMLHLTGRLISSKYAATSNRENIAKFVIYEFRVVLSTR